ncbi:signal peptidase I [Lentzea atacamensis]|uniref:Signal peptidase I n=1 Tax=Lentzea atacamensis TaxID=531938 RepID=A0A316I9S3_9PSEU|nr:signal peptidase I [Lentzea atacamensis]PWK89146.1 signal peptidase I [Lentzea atacamensis]RAS61867.1 signal peptidase I [Lentzea atacamensis]
MASSPEDFEDASAPDEPERGRTPVWREILYVVVTAVVLTVLIQAFVARVYVIPSASMERTLHGCTGCENDRVLVDKVAYRFGDVEAGEVVVFRGPEAWTTNDFRVAPSANPVARAVQNIGSLLGIAPANERDFVKRVIALPGQTVMCCDEQHRVVVDGKPLDEPYIYWQPGTSSANHEPFAPVRVPEGRLFVMGDNRMNSTDSRKQGGGGVAGTIPIENVIGKARYIVFPKDRWSVVSDHNPQPLG